MTYHINRPEIKLDSWKIFTEILTILMTIETIMLASDHAAERHFSGVFFEPANVC